MNTRRFPLLVCFCCFLIGCGASQWRGIPAAAASRDARRSVVDCYMRLPARYFEVFTPAERRALLKPVPGDASRTPIVDLKNDYLQVPADGAQGSLTMAVFRHAGRDLIAVLYAGYDPAVPSLTFNRYNATRWHDVNREALPGDVAEFIKETHDDGNRDGDSYVLPRSGTTVTCRDSGDAGQWSLSWRHGRFVEAGDR